MEVQGLSNPRFSAGYVANGQPLGITIGPEKQPTSADGGTAVNVKVITGDAPLKAWPTHPVTGPVNTERLRALVQLTKVEVPQEGMRALDLASSVG